MRLVGFKASQFEGADEWLNDAAQAGLNDAAQAGAGQMRIDELLTTTTTNVNVNASASAEAAGGHLSALEDAAPRGYSPGRNSAVLGSLDLGHIMQQGGAGGNGMGGRPGGGAGGGGHGSHGGMAHGGGGHAHQTIIPSEGWGGAGTSGKAAGDSASATYLCLECGRNVSVTIRAEHDDWHFARTLQREDSAPAASSAGARGGSRDRGGGAAAGHKARHKSHKSQGGAQATLHSLLGPTKQDFK